MHKVCGIYVFVASIAHSIFHTIRIIGLRGQISAYFLNPTGWSGILAVFCGFLIVLPFWVERIRKGISFEARKATHYLFIVWMIALAIHSPRSLIISCVLLVCYCVDYALNLLSHTYKVDHASFRVVGRGIVISFEIPRGMPVFAGQYVYCNIPWISRAQWHPFSLMVETSSSGKVMGCLYIVSVGDWTKRLMSITLAERHNPTIWLNGPHPSPFMESSDFSNLVLIASGAGITPAISVIENYHSRREMHMIFVTNEVNMVKFFLNTLAKVSARIFFTGSKEEYAQLEAFMKTVNNVSKVVVKEIPGSESPKNNPLKSPSGTAKTPFPDPYSGAGRKHAMTVYFAAEIPEIDYLDVNQDIESAGQQDHLISHNHIQLIQGRPDISSEINERIRSNTFAERSSALQKNLTAHELGNYQYLTRESVILETAHVSKKNNNSAVLYCGASVPLRNAVQSACKDLKVQYYTEYFGEW
jgi:NAD(P)H-flavin reductase